MAETWLRWIDVRDGYGISISLLYRAALRGQIRVQHGPRGRLFYHARDVAELAARRAQPNAGEQVPA